MTFTLPPRSWRYSSYFGFYMEQEGACWQVYAPDGTRIAKSANWYRAMLFMLAQRQEQAEKAVRA